MFLDRIKIAYVAVEVSPLAKVGGLADVAASLPPALAELGHEVVTVMPAYGMALRDSRCVETSAPVSFDFKLGDTTHHAALHIAEIEGRKTWLIEGPASFSNCKSSEEVYVASRDDYLWFSAAVLAACEAMDWTPDVIHCNDWHTGFIPVLMREKGPFTWAQAATIFTIHNLAYQGEFGLDTLDVCGLPYSLFNPHQLETYGLVSFLKSGCVYSDIATTVSPTYAQEIRTPEFGCRLEGLMHWLAENDRLIGILNGIDTSEFNPATDAKIAANYSIDDLTGKAECRASLLRECGWDESAVPVASIISRLSEQKGFNFLLESLEQILSLPVRIVALAIGSPSLANQLREAEKKHPNRFKFVERFDIEFAQRLYAGSDLFLMPSAYEPCGLGQMIAMRYGSVPIVRRTGGLADTVHDGANGFVFEARSGQALYEAIYRAVECRQDSDRWSRIVEHGMRGEFSWNSRSEEYVAVYRRAIATRRPSLCAVD